MRVLITDDSRATRTILRRMVEKIGFEVIEAINGAEALGLLHCEEVDLCLVDWNMPMMNGLELIKRMKANPDFKHIAIILVTDEFVQEKIDEAMAAGADAYLEKPFDEYALALQIRELRTQA